jgi:hypothetical protein
LKVVKCPETIKRKEELVYSKWFNINENISYRKIISCKNITKLKTIGNYLLKTKCKRETKMEGGGGATPPEISWKQKCKM